MFKRNNFLFALILLCSSIAYANTDYEIKSSDTLEKIASSYYKGGEFSRNQVYIGLLAENPQAFTRGNINYLKNKESMVIPALANLKLMSKKDADNLVAEHKLIARENSKSQIPPPFDNYSPNKPSNTNKQELVAEKQLTTDTELKKLKLEADQLEKRLKEMTEENAAKDAELRQLDKLLFDN